MRYGKHLICGQKPRVEAQDHRAPGLGAAVSAATEARADIKVEVGADHLAFAEVCAPRWCRRPLA